MPLRPAIEHPDLLLLVPSPSASSHAVEYEYASQALVGYSETVDQPALASVFDLDAAERLPSFAKLKRDLVRIATTS